MQINERRIGLLIQPITYSVMTVITLMHNWRPFYEARFGVEIFVELYDSTLSSSVSSYVLERYITSYLIAFTIGVYCYYGYLLIS